LERKHGLTKSRLVCNIDNEHHR